MTVLLFPGQGSQQKGMGGQLFSRHAALTRQYSDILGYSLEELCLHDPDEKLNNTQFCQPAIFFVNCLGYIEEKEKKSNFHFALGHSLGEYNALHAADVFDLETGLKLVKKRSELMAKVGAGGMLAILGKSIKEVQQMINEAACHDVDIANHNTPTQLVLSGPIASIQQMAAYCTEKKVKAIPLKVSGAFHSRYMRDVEEEFQTFLETFEFSTPKIPVISNFTAQEYTKSNIKSNLIRQISHGVRWVESIEFVLNKGESEFKEISSGILTRMVKEIKDSFQKKDNSADVRQNGENCSRMTCHSIGTSKFQDMLGIRYNYVSGAMYRGIASVDMVIKMAKSGLLSFLGAGGLSDKELELALEKLNHELKKDYSFGVNFLCNYLEPEAEFRFVDALLKYQITIVEASAFLSVTPALAYYAIKGLYEDPKTGEVRNKHKIFAKVSRPELAKIFMNLVPEKVLQNLVEKKRISAREAQLARKFPLSQYVCVEADSGGHTDQGSLITLLPAFLKIRSDMEKQFHCPIFIGAAGGIGSPEAIAAAFILGADFVQTGSINQCSVESGTSEKVKELLQVIDVSDTDYAPAGDMFEIGAKVQVLKKGVLFPVRANKLHHIYHLFSSVDDIPSVIRTQIEEKFFRKAFHEIFNEAKEYFASKNMHREIEHAMQNPKHKMSLIFRWYLGKSNQWAIQGNLERVVDYQVHTGPALGAFNRWVQGTKLENWKHRHVDEMAILLMESAAEIMNQKLRL